MKQAVIISFIIISLNCSNAIKINLSDQPPKPDLVIKKVTYRVTSPRQSYNPKHLGGVVMMPLEYEFKITVTNKGAAEWWGDFYIQYDFYSEQNSGVSTPQYHLVLMEESTLPIKETMDITLPPQWLPLRENIKKIVFILNPTIQDTTLELVEHSEEFFTNNNSYQLTL